MRRDWWHLDFLSQLDGVTLVDNGGQKFRIAGQSEQPPIASVTGRVGCSGPIMADHFRFLADVVAREHGNIHRSGEFSAAAIVRLLERCDAFRKPARFAEVVAQAGVANR